MDSRIIRTTPASQFSRQALATPFPAKLLSPKQTSEILNVAIETLAVWRATKRYPLPWVKIGRNVMYKLEDVQAFIESRTVSPVEVAR